MTVRDIPVLEAGSPQRAMLPGPRQHNRGICGYGERAVPLNSLAETHAPTTLISHIFRIFEDAQPLSEHWAWNCRCPNGRRVYRDGLFEHSRFSRAIGARTTNTMCEREALTPDQMPTLRQVLHLELGPCQSRSEVNCRVRVKANRARQH